MLGRHQSHSQRINITVLVNITNNERPCHVDLYCTYKAQCQLSPVSVFKNIPSLVQVLQYAKFPVYLQFLMECQMREPSCLITRISELHGNTQLSLDVFIVRIERIRIRNDMILQSYITNIYNTPILRLLQNITPKIGFKGCIENLELLRLQLFNRTEIQPYPSRVFGEWIPDYY